VLPVPSITAKRGNSRLTVVLLAMAALFSVGLLLWSNYPFTAPAPQWQKLIGRWQRPDGGYILAIHSIGADGALAAGYFNPNSIHVGKAEASTDGGAMKVFIELRDVNYPGSTYDLTYDPANDQLKGIYYQAVEKQRFAVAFVRLK
jgi:hypothetical protein